MSKNIYNILKEPTGQNYYDLLDYALGKYPFFLLITEKITKQLNPRGKKVLSELTPFIFRIQLKSEWPGTIIYGGEAMVYTYHFTPESAAILKESANRLYQWQIPELPDDLCLLRVDETPWLVNIAHESDSFFNMNTEEMRSFLKALPAYEAMIKIRD